MSWTKLQLVTEAFAELALAGYDFDITPEELQTGLRRLDSLLASWDGMGRRLGYNLLSREQSDLDDDSGLPDWAIRAVFLNLAIELASGWGKAVPQSTIGPASAALAVIDSRCALPTRMRFPNTLPRGAGNKPWVTTSNPFMPTVREPVEAGPDGPIEYN